MHGAVILIRSKEESRLVVARSFKLAELCSEMREEARSLQREFDVSQDRPPATCPETTEPESTNPQTRFRRHGKIGLNEVVWNDRSLMKTLTYILETPTYKRTGSVSLTLLSLVMTGPIMAVCSGGGVAQTPIATAAPQPEVTATRQRRSTTEVSSRDRTTAASVERPAAARPERRVFVRSTSLLVRAAVVEEKLLKQPEFRRLGFVITREESDADLILELRHDLLTKYVFTVVDAKTSVVLLGGKLSSLGGTVAGKVARRFVKEMPAAGP